jgi:Killing trait
MATDGQTSGSTASDPQSLATAPAAMLGTLYAAMGQALANAARNAVAAQQQAQVTAQAATTMGVATMFSLDTASTGVAAQKEIDRK